VSEHGSDYQVPSEIANHPDLKDLSWKNDMSPRFTGERADGRKVEVWVEHPDPAQREMGGKRFLMEFKDKDDNTFKVMTTDDLGDALGMIGTFMKTFPGQTQAPQADRSELIKERLYDLGKKGPGMTEQEEVEYKQLLDERKQMGHGSPGFLLAWVRRNCRLAGSDDRPTCFEPCGSELVYEDSAGRDTETMGGLSVEYFACPKCGQKYSRNEGNPDIMIED
jgi:hypothetical protein